LQVQVQVIDAYHQHQLRVPDDEVIRWKQHAACVRIRLGQGWCRNFHSRRHNFRPVNVDRSGLIRALQALAKLVKYVGMLAVHQMTDIKK